MYYCSPKHEFIAHELGRTSEKRAGIKEIIDWHLFVNY